MEPVAELVEPCLSTDEVLEIGCSHTQWLAQLLPKVSITDKREFWVRVRVWLGIMAILLESIRIMFWVRVKASQCPGLGLWVNVSFRVRV